MVSKVNLDNVAYDDPDYDVVQVKHFLSYADGEVSDLNTWLRVAMKKKHHIVDIIQTEKNVYIYYQRRNGT